jgi:zinc protease
MNRLLIVIGLLLLALSAFGQQQNPRDMKFPQIEFNPATPQEFTTDNGIKVFFLEDHKLPVVTLDAYFKGGDIYDPQEKVGLASLTASLMRNGGAGKRTPDQVDFDLEFLAANIDCNSGQESFNIGLRTLRKDLDKTAGILADIIQKPTFDTAKVALEKSVTQDQIRRQNDDPGQVTRRVFYQTIYGDHPYGWYPTLASIDKINRADIIDNYKKYFVPNNCIMAISGDLTLNDVKALLKKYFGDWKKSELNLPNKPMAEATYKPGIYYAAKDINQANIRFGHLLMTDDNPDQYAFEIMNFALGGGGFSSRMMSQVRTTAGLAYSVGSYPVYRPLMGLHFSYCLTKAESLSKTLQMMFDVINDVRTNGITEDEMELAKESTINSYIFGFDTPAKLVNAYASNELRGFPKDKIKTDLEKYQAVTLEKCNQVAKYYLNTDDIVIVITGNKDLFDKPLDSFGPVTNVSMEIK